MSDSEEQDATKSEDSESEQSDDDSFEEVEISSKYLPKLSLPGEGILIIESPLGTGKTTSIISMIKGEGPEKILFLMFRRSLTRNLVGKLSGLKFSNYQKTSGPVKKPRLLIQIESLHRLARTDYDWVIIDEITSVLCQFGSPFHKDNLDVNRKIFQKLLRCPKVILMDGFIDDRVRDFVNTFDRPVSILRNRIRTDFRKYQYVEYTMVRRIIGNWIQNGRRFVLVCGTKKVALMLKKYILSIFRNTSSEKKIILFCGDQNESADLELLEEIDDVVVEYDVLIFTPVLQAGVDISVKHFDRMLAIGSPFSCCARDFFQMTWRIRDISENIVCYTVQDGKATFDMPKSLVDPNVKRSTWEHLRRQVFLEEEKSKKDFRKEFESYAARNSQM